VTDAWRQTEWTRETQPVSRPALKTRISAISSRRSGFHGGGAKPVVRPVVTRQVARNDCGEGSVEGAITSRLWFRCGVPPADRLARETFGRRPSRAGDGRTSHQRVSRLGPPSAVGRPNPRVSCRCQYTIPSRLASNKRSSTPAARMRWRCRIRSLRIERARSAVAGSPLISAPAARARPLTRRHRPRARAPQRSPVHQVGAGTAKTSFVASPSPLPRRVEHKVCAPGGRCRTGRRARLQDGFRPVRGAPSKGERADERRLAGDRRGF
jgi:hypothetical protein